MQMKNPSSEEERKESLLAKRLCNKRRYFSDQDTLQLAALREESEKKRKADRAPEIEKSKAEQAHRGKRVRDKGKKGKVAMMSSLAFPS